MNQRDSVIARIEQLLRHSLHLGPFVADTDLLEGGMIDSAGFMELFVLLENEFSIRIEGADLVLEHFRSASRMADFVMEKHASPGPAGE